MMTCRNAGFTDGSQYRARHRTALLILHRCPVNGHTNTPEKKSFTSKHNTSADKEAYHRGLPVARNVGMSFAICIALGGHLWNG